MPETTAEKAAETPRRYIREAEDVAQNAFRAGNDYLTTTMNFYFDTWDRAMHDSMEVMNLTWHAMDDLMVIYRKAYSYGVENYQAYLKEVNKIVPHPAK